MSTRSEDVLANAPWASTTEPQVQDAPFATATAPSDGAPDAPFVAAQIPTPSAPAENQSPDNPSPLDRIGKWFGSLYNRLDTPVENPRTLNELLYKEVGRAASGLNAVAIGTLKAPGQGLEAAMNLSSSLEKNVPESFRPPSWAKTPAMYMFTGSNNLLNKLQDEVTMAPSNNLQDQLPEAFGSALAFMGTGSVASAGGVNPYLTSAALGGAVGASQQYDDAIAHGATPEQAAIAYAGGFAFGTTEAVPGAWFLGKLNKLTGGQVAEAIKKYGVQGEASPLVEAIKGMFEEAVQEGVQQVGQNWVASDLAGYDPTRTLGENFWSSVITGGLVGSFVGGGLGLMRKAEVNQVLKDEEAKRNLQLATGNPINYIDGSFTPVGDLVNLRKLSDDLKLDLAARTQQASAEAQLNAGENNDLIPQSKQGPEYIGVLQGSKGDFTSKLLDKPINLRVEKSIAPVQPDGTPTTVRQALALTPVVAVETNPYADMLRSLSSSIKEYESRLSQLAEAGVSQDSTKAILEILKRRRLDVAAKAKIADDLTSQVKQYSAIFSQVFSPDTKVVISGTPTFVGPKKDSVSGFITITHDVTPVGGKTVPVASIYIDLDRLATAIYADKQGGASDLAQRRKRELFEVLNHELGHMIAISTIHRLYNDIRTKPPAEAQSATQLLDLLHEEYGRWLKDASQSNLDFLLSTQFAPERTLGDIRHLASIGVNAATSPMTAPFPPGYKKDYLLSFDEFFAEMTARLATQGRFADEVTTKYFAPALQQYRTMFERMPQFARLEYGTDWNKFLNTLKYDYKVKKELEKVAAGGGTGIINVLRNGLDGFNPEAFAGLQEHLDRFDKLISWGFNLMQLAKENPHIPHISSYLQGVAAWAEYQRNFQADAVDTYKAWRALGKVEAAQLTDVLFEEALDRKLIPGIELSKRLTGEALAVYNQVRDQFNRVLEEMRAVSLQDAARTIIDNEEMLNAEIAGINEDFDRLRDTGYFPFIRFGKYTITARAKESLEYNGNLYEKGQLISFPSFETEKERDSALEEIRKDLGTKATVASSVMRETDFVIQGMPRTLLRSLRAKLEATGDFTTEQAKAFEVAMSEVAPFRNFRKHFLKKKGIEGYSEDALRSFAYYIRSAAGHIARVKFSDSLREPVQGLQNDVEIIKEIGGRADERQEMRHWLDRHFSYIMNPDNEWAALRGVGFVSYLGFNVKSALVNGTQLLTTVGPYLAARYGDTRAISELTKATWTLKDWIARRQDFTKAVEGSVKHRILQMIERGKHEGWLDQSLATELAIAASENNLDRGLYLPKVRRFWHEVSRFSALPFHLVEKMNRYITAISAYQLEFNESGSHEKAVLAARQANWSANYENARWNRPEFMRGKKSVFFLFANYLQNTLYFATHDKGALRYWLMMMLLGGLMGLPGSEDVSDLVDFAATYFNRLLGLKNPKTQIRRELRQHLEELGANPDLILHGLSQDSFGWGHVGELTGLPIPHLDVSRSVGMGDVLPLTEVPSMFLQSEPNDILVAAAQGAAGASGNLVEQYYRNLLSSDPDGWKKAERLLPIVAARNVMKAVRLATRGEEKTASGDLIGKFDPHDLRQQLELLGQSLGFSPSQLTLGWEREIAQRDNTQYYKVQQESLLRQIDWAFLQDDREAKADALEAIHKYNSQVPLPEMKIGSDTIKSSLRSYLEKQVTSGMGLAAEKKYRRLRKEVEQSYPDPYGKENKATGATP